jgi:hypothetical protein
MKSIRPFLLALLALPLAAQSSGFSVGGGLIAGLDSYKKAVNSNTGFGVNAAFDTVVHGTDVPIRLQVGLDSMPGKATNGLKTSLTHVQLASDLLVDTGVSGLRGLAGLSLNSYSASFSGTESTSASDASHHFPFKDVKGIKLGLRLGLEYAFDKAWSGEVVLQQTELAGQDKSDPLVRVGGVNPAWLQVGVRYRF